MAPKAPASEVFGSFSNSGGWNSIGTACFVGTISATGSFAGSDAPAHLAEEVKDASRAVPRMMMATILLNGVMGFVMIITYVRVETLDPAWSLLLIDRSRCSASPICRPFLRRNRRLCLWMYVESGVALCRSSC